MGTALRCITAAQRRPRLQAPRASAAREAPGRAPVWLQAQGTPSGRARHKGRFNLPSPNQALGGGAARACMSSRNVRRSMDDGRLYAPMRRLGRHVSRPARPPLSRRASRPPHSPARAARAGVTRGAGALSSRRCCSRRERVARKSPSSPHQRPRRAVRESVFERRAGAEAAPEAMRSRWFLRCSSGMLRMYCSRRACRRPFMWSCERAARTASRQPQVVC